MIKKIVYLKNVGRFHDAHPGEDGKCGKITLVSAQNGSGKTTVAAILHSLASGEPGFITERDSVSTTGTPEVKLLMDDECYDFENGKWQQDVSDVKIEVFDTHFINTNVYAGDYFEHKHKKALYQFIIGEIAGDLDSKIREINDKSITLSQKIRNLKADIKQHIVGELTLDDFINLPKVNDVETKLKDKKERVRQLKRIDTLQKRSRFDELSSFTIPDSTIEEVLGRTLDDISDAAEEKLRTHLEERTDGATEEWVDSGVSYVEDEICPFCGSNIAENDTVQAFKKYFSKEYSQHKKHIERLIGKVDSYLPSGGWRQIKASFDSNASLFDTWAEDIDFEDITPYEFVEDVEEIWKHVRSSIIEDLKRKKESPLEAYQLAESSNEAISQFRKLMNKITSYNKQIQAWNNKVDNFKEGLKGGNLKEAERELCYFESCQKRNQKKVHKLCESLIGFQEEKQKLQDEKARKREELDAVEKKLMEKYHSKIKDFLEDAGADFRIVELEKSMSGGNPSTNYAIEISGETIEIGSARTEIGEKGFRNILSEGDRNTLAFAFFYAKVMTAPNVKAKTIVIDDPVSSLDSIRRFATLKAIIKIYELAEQVVILSHDPRFLVKLADEIKIKSKNIDSTIMHLRKEFSPSSSEIESISPNELKAQMDDKHIRAIKKIKAFYYDGDTGNLDGVENSLRIVLEDTLSRRYPERNLRMSSTSAWEGAIEDANPDSPLYELKNGPYHETLKELNYFIHDSHHAGNLPGSPNEDISQLRVLAKKTLKFVYGTLQ